MKKPSLFSMKSKLSFFEDMFFMCEDWFGHVWNLKVRTWSYMNDI